MSLEEIGKEYTLSGEAVRRRIYKNNIKLVTIFSSAIKDRSDKYWDKKNYDALEKKYNHLKNFIEGLEFMKKELNVPAVPAEPMPVNYSIRFIDLDNINVRLVNCLKAADVETIGDLMSLTKIDLLKYRNFGKKSLKELEDILAKFGISWNGEHPQANSEEKKN
ncbi:MAG: hypothetical protein HY063_04170 [Bacteroidetes bacterium]|nr:hypothetical protein [Bacteroidota bacterium]